MSYSRFLDVFIADNFDRATFERDVGVQRKHQMDKNVAYDIIVVPPLSVRRGVVVQEWEEKIQWVCAADGGGGKLRVNAHGGKGGIKNNVGEQITMVQLAEFLVKHGMTDQNMGNPGLKTINLAVCYAASGAKDQWLIKALGDELKMPGIKITGADAITQMNDDGELMVKYPKYVPPPLRKYVPPALRGRVDPPMAEARFKDSILKKEYTYAG